MRLTSLTLSFALVGAAMCVALLLPPPFAQALPSTAGAAGAPAGTAGAADTHQARRRPAAGDAPQALGCDYFKPAQLA